jgi:hypothetical protein
LATPSAVLNYKLIKKVKDEKFDVDSLQQYSLLIQLGVRDMQVGVVDTREDRIILLEDYILDDLQSSEEQLQLLKSLFESHALLLAGFWKNVKFSIKNNKFIQVPSALFVEEAAGEYLTFNANVNPDKEEVLFCRHGKSEIITVFSIYSELKKWVTSLYPNAKVHFVHHSASFIDGVLELADSHSDQPIYVYVDRFKLHIAYVSDGHLVYYNQFAVKHFSDYVKYIMLVLKSLRMDQRQSRVVLWGYIGKNSPHAIEFSKYISNVSFGSRPSYLKFGYLFDEIQEHHFYDLYNIHLLN